MTRFYVFMLYLVLVSNFFIWVKCVEKLNFPLKSRYEQARFFPGIIIFVFLWCIIGLFFKDIILFFERFSLFNTIISFFSPSGKIEYYQKSLMLLIANAFIFWSYFSFKLITKKIIIRANKSINGLYDAKGETEDKKEKLSIANTFWNVIHLFYNTQSGERGSVFEIVMIGFIRIFYEVNETGEIVIRLKWQLVKRTLAVFGFILGLAFIGIITFLMKPLLAPYTGDDYKFFGWIVGLLFIFPSILFIVVNEFRAFLGDFEMFEKFETLSAEKLELNKVTDYRALMDPIKEQFLDRFIGSYSVGGEFEKNLIEDELTDNPRIIPSHQVEQHYNEWNPEVWTKDKLHIRLCNFFMNYLRTNKSEIKEGYMHAFLRLLEGHNILTDAVITSDFKDSLFNYLNYKLAENHTILFLVNNESDGEELKRIIKAEFLKINFLDEIWKIKSRDEAEIFETTDILIMTPQFIVDEKITGTQDAFFKRLSTIILINTEELVASSSILPMIMAWNFNDRYQLKPQYICLANECNTGLRDNLEHVFQIDELSIVKGIPDCTGKTDIMFWSEEGNSWAQDTLTSLRRTGNYYGIAFALAICSIDHGGISNVDMMIDSQIAYKEKYDNLLSDVELFIDPYFVKNNLRINRFKENWKEDTFIITNDSENNIFAVIRKCRRLMGAENTMIHIISRNYLLRNYLYYCIQNSFDNNILVDRFFPVVDFSTKTIVLKLILKAYRMGLTEKEIFDKLSDILGTVSINEMLIYCIKVITNNEAIISIYEYFQFNYEWSYSVDEEKFQRGCRIKLINSKTYGEILNHLQKARIVYTNMDKKVSIDVLKCNVFQNYLQNQLCVIEGKNYCVEKINEETGEVEVENRSHIKDVPRYVQNRNYQLDFSQMSKYRELIGETDEDESLLASYTIGLYEGKTKVETFGYYEVNEKPIFVKNKSLYIKLSEKEKRRCMRTHVNSKVLKIELHSSSIEGLEHFDKIANTLAILITEFLPSLFPLCHQYLGVCPVIMNREKLREDEIYKEELEQYYPQLKDQPNIKDLSKITLYIFEDSQVDIGVIASLFDNFNVLMELMHDYLQWYIKSDEMVKRHSNFNSELITKDYLNFGGESLPESLDLINVLEIIKPLKYTKRGETKDFPLLDLKGICAFCGRNIRAAEFYEFTDHRKICPECYNLKTTAKNELGKLYKLALDYIEENYHVHLSRDIRLKFESADTIRHRLSQAGLILPMDSRCLGLAYNDGSKQIVVETGAPRANLLATIVHELTHLWQFDQLNMEEIPLEITEGHSSYIECHVLLHLGYKNHGRKTIKELEKREDEYGRGYREIVEILKVENSKNPFEYIKNTYPKKIK